mmetsp:Transcript_69206/g.193551  ORF Transcript_69206/g.193551 Transcript_69206/m.193551 type:complete len:299 (-) Transcript_69206:2191-3087(-)
MSLTPSQCPPNSLDTITKNIEMPNAVNSWYAFGSAKSRQLNISRRSMSKMANGQYRGPYKRKKKLSAASDAPPRLVVRASISRRRDQRSNARPNGKPTTHTTAISHANKRTASYSAPVAGMLRSAVMYASKVPSPLSNSVTANAWQTVVATGGTSMYSILSTYFSMSAPCSRASVRRPPLCVLPQMRPPAYHATTAALPSKNTNDNASGAMVVRRRRSTKLVWPPIQSTCKISKKSNAKTFATPTIALKGCGKSEPPWNVCAAAILIMIWYVTTNMFEWLSIMRNSSLYLLYMSLSLF